MRSTGSGSMITPVENGRICSGDSVSWRASAMQVARARTRPSSPVPALALPVLITMARTPVPGQMLAADLHGAAQKRFWVNTPATCAFVEQEHRQVLAIGLAHAGFGDANAHAGDPEADQREAERKIHRHGRLSKQRPLPARVCHAPAGPNEQRRPQPVSG
jgi:hypothetical protein